MGTRSNFPWATATPTSMDTGFINIINGAPHFSNLAREAWWALGISFVMRMCAMRGTALTLGRPSWGRPALGLSPGAGEGPRRATAVAQADGFIELRGASVTYDYDSRASLRGAWTALT